MYNEILFNTNIHYKIYSFIVIYNIKKELHQSEYPIPFTRIIHPSNYFHPKLCFLHF